jgi:hypothetical protein
MVVVSDEFVARADHAADHAAYQAVSEGEYPYPVGCPVDADLAEDR